MEMFRHPDFIVFGLNSANAPGLFATSAAMRAAKGAVPSHIPSHAGVTVIDAVDLNLAAPTIASIMLLPTFVAVKVAWYMPFPA